MFNSNRESSYVIGIDFGTSKTCASIWDKSNSNFSILEGTYDRALVNYVAIKSNSERIIGEFAKLKIRTNYKNIIFDSKILLGKTSIQQDESIKLNQDRWPFELLETEKKVFIKLVNKIDETYLPEEITGLFLKKIKEEAERKTDTDSIDEAIITLPASFNEYQYGAILEASKIAGFQFVNLLNETTAAVLAVVHDKKITGSKKNILLFDLGAWNLSLCLFELNDKNQIIIKHSASYSDLGGEMYDKNMVDYIIKGLTDMQKGSILKNKDKFKQALFENCEKCKKMLSNMLEAEINIENIFENDEDFNFTFTRDLFEEINSNLFEKCIENITNFLNEVNLNKDKIEDVFLIGSCSHIPNIKKNLKNYFNNLQHLNLSLNASESVAYGASIYAANLYEIIHLKENINNDDNNKNENEPKRLSQSISKISRNSINSSDKNIDKNRKSSFFGNFSCGLNSIRKTAINRCIIS